MASDPAEHPAPGVLKGILSSPRRMYAVVSLIAVVVHLNGIFGDYVHDDLSVVVSNPDVQGTTSIGQLFLNDFWGRRLSHPLSHKSYRPLTVLTFRLERWVVGHSVPCLSHLGNVALHAAATALYARVLLSELKLPPAHSLLCAVIFAVHPIHTEAVTGVVGRADLLAAITFLACFCAYNRAMGASKPKRSPESTKLSESCRKKHNFAEVSYKQQNSSSNSSYFDKKNNSLTIESWKPFRKPTRKNRKFKTSDRPRKKILSSGISTNNGPIFHSPSRTTESRKPHLFMNKIHEIIQYINSASSLLINSCVGAFLTSMISPHSKSNERLASCIHGFSVGDKVKKQKTRRGSYNPNGSLPSAPVQGVLQGSSFPPSADFYVPSGEKSPPSLKWCYLWAIVGVLCKETAVTSLGACVAWEGIIAVRRFIGRRAEGANCRREQVSRVGRVGMLGLVVVGARFLLMGSPPLFSSQENPASFCSSTRTRCWTFCFLASYNSWLLLCPASLSCDWQLGSIPLLSEPGSDPRAVAPIVLASAVILLAGAAVRDRRGAEGRALAWSLAVMVCGFLPASNLFFSVGFVLAERLLYIPSLGFCSIIGIGAMRLISITVPTETVKTPPNHLKYDSAIGFSKQESHPKQFCVNFIKRNATCPNIQQNRPCEEMTTGTMTHLSSDTNHSTCLSKFITIDHITEGTQRHDSDSYDLISREENLFDSYTSDIPEFRENLHPLNRETNLDSSGYSSAHSSNVSSEEPSPVSSPYTSPISHPTSYCSQTRDLFPIVSTAATNAVHDSCASDRADVATESRTVAKRGIPLGILPNIPSQSLNSHPSRSSSKGCRKSFWANRNHRTSSESERGASINEAKKPNQSYSLGISSKVESKGDLAFQKSYQCCAFVSGWDGIEVSLPPATKTVFLCCLQDTHETCTRLLDGEITNTVIYCQECSENILVGDAVKKRPLSFSKFDHIMNQNSCRKIQSCLDQSIQKSSFKTNFGISQTRQHSENSFHLKICARTYVYANRNGHINVNDVKHKFYHISDTSASKSYSDKTRTWDMSKLDLSKPMTCKNKRTTDSFVIFMSKLRYIINILKIHTIFRNSKSENVVKRCERDGGMQWSCVKLFLLFLIISFTVKTLRRNMDWSSRETLLKSGLAVLPNNAKFHYNYGNLLRERNNYVDAVRHYNEAIRLWPEYPSARNNLAAVLVLQGQLREAEQQLQLVVLRFPGHHNAAINLAKLHKRENRLTEAQQILRNALLVSAEFRGDEDNQEMKELLSSLSEEGRLEAEDRTQVILEDPIRERAVEKDVEEADVEEEDAQEENVEEANVEEADTEEEEAVKHLQVILETPNDRSTPISEEDTADEGDAVEGSPGPMAIPSELRSTPSPTSMAALNFGAKDGLLPPYPTTHRSSSRANPSRDVHHCSSYTSRSPRMALNVVNGPATGTTSAAGTISTIGTSITNRTNLPTRSTSLPSVVQSSLRGRVNLHKMDMGACRMEDGSMVTPMQTKNP